MTRRPFREGLRAGCAFALNLIIFVTIVVLIARKS